MREIAVVAVAPAIELFRRRNRQHVLQRIGKNDALQEGSEGGHDRQQPDALAEIDRARGAARLEGQTMRPFSGADAHGFEQPRPRRKGIACRSPRVAAKRSRVSSCQACAAKASRAKSGMKKM